jgi:hypothetical protein
MEDLFTPKPVVCRSKEHTSNPIRIDLIKDVTPDYQISLLAPCYCMFTWVDKYEVCERQPAYLRVVSVVL